MSSAHHHHHIDPLLAPATAVADQDVEAAPSEKIAGEKQQSVSSQDSPHPGQVLLTHGADSGLQRRLHSRAVFMISIGSSIGMGLWLGSGTSLKHGGPASLFLGYIICSGMGMALMQSIGELAVAYPVPSAFIIWSRNLVDPAVAMSMGYSSVFANAITIPNELSGLVTCFQYWVPEKRVPPVAWILIFLFAYLFINIFAVNFFGEFESLTSFIKFSFIFVVIIVGIIISAGGAPEGDPIGFRYWNSTPFVNGFKGFLSVFPNTVFALSGIESSALVAAETINPRKAFPKAVNSIWIRLCLFYILGSIIVTITVSPKAEDLFGGSGTNASPFVIAFKNGGLPRLADFMNAIIILSVFSTGNVAFYAAPRELMGLAKLGYAPKLFLKADKKGRPWPGLILTFVFGGGLSFLLVDNTGSTVFSWFSSLVSLCTLYKWMIIFLCQIRLRYAIKAHGLTPQEWLPWYSRFYKYGATHFGISLCIILVIVEFYLALFPLGESPSAKNFFSEYVSIVLMLFAYLVGKAIFRSPFYIKAHNINIESDRRWYYADDADEGQDPLYKMLRFGRSKKT